MKVLFIFLSILVFCEGSSRSIIQNSRWGRANDGKRGKPEEKDYISAIASTIDNKVEAEDKGWGWGIPPQYASVGISHSPVFGWENGAVGKTPIGWILVKPQTCSGWSPASTTTQTQSVTQTGWVWYTSTTTSTHHQIFTSTTFLTGWAWPSTSSILATIEILPTIKVSYVTLTSTKTVEAPTPTSYQTITTTITSSYTTSIQTTSVPYTIPTTTETELTTTISKSYTSTGTVIISSTMPICTETVTQYAATTTIPTSYVPSITCSATPEKILSIGENQCTTLSTSTTITTTVTEITTVTSTITGTGLQYVTSLNLLSPNFFTATITRFVPFQTLVTTTSTLTYDLASTVVTSTLSLPSGQSTGTFISTTDFCTLTKTDVTTVYVTTTPAQVTSFTTQIIYVNGQAILISTVFTNVMIPTVTQTLTETLLTDKTTTLTATITTAPTSTTTLVTDFSTTFYGITETIATSTIVVEQVQTLTSTHFVLTTTIETTDTTEDPPQTTSVVFKDLKGYFINTQTEVTTETVTPTATLTASDIIMSVPCSVSGGWGGWSGGWGGWSAGWNGGWKKEQDESYEGVHSATTPLPSDFGSI